MDESLQKESEYEDLEFTANGCVSEPDFGVVEAYFGCLLPEAYKTFMISANSGEGFVGETYLVLWRVEELIEFNHDYQAAELAPGMLLFGSDGASEGVAFDTREGRMNVVVIPLIGMDLESALPLASDFTSFMDRIANGLFPDHTL